MKKQFKRCIKSLTSERLGKLCLFTSRELIPAIYKETIEIRLKRRAHPIGKMGQSI